MLKKNNICNIIHLLSIKINKFKIHTFLKKKKIKFDFGVKNIYPHGIFGFAKNANQL